MMFRLAMIGCLWLTLIFLSLAGLSLARLTPRPAAPATIAGADIRTVANSKPALESANASVTRSNQDEAPTAEDLDFRQHILPILGDHCLTCHGFDEGTRASGLRLDIREMALAGGDSGLPAIVPDSADTSELVARIFSDDPGVIMPPPGTQPPLNPAQRDLLKRWIDSGAPYAQHWGFVPPTDRPLPDLHWPNAVQPQTDETANPTHNRHDNENDTAQPTTTTATAPIDRWVLQGLQRQGWSPAPPAPPALLARRLYLDLIGLPPSPAEIERYLTVGHEQTVEELLQRPQYGERWARIWLDAARYSDTNGYEKDLRRDQWIWRDWVVDAYNRDQPYDQFIIEQIAGDLLPNATPQQIIATGFLRNSMLNEEGAIIPEEFRLAEMFDRMDCVGKAVLGLTTQCAQCHTHKFDPLTHTEYFGLFAFLNNSYEAQSWVYTPADEQRRQELLAAITAAEDAALPWPTAGDTAPTPVTTDAAPTADVGAAPAPPAWLPQLWDWATQIHAATPAWQIVPMDDLGSVSGLNHPVQLEDGSILMLGHTSGDVYFLATPELTGATGLQLEILAHGDLPFLGPGRSSLGTWEISELEVWTRLAGQDWQKESLVNPSADASAPDNSAPDAKQKSGPVAFLVDGQDNTQWRVDRGPGRRNQDSVAVVQFAAPLTHQPGTQLKIVLRMGAMVGCCRVSLTTAPQPQTPAVDYSAQRIVRAMDLSGHDPAAAWARLTADQQQTLRSAWRQVSGQFPQVDQAIAALWQQYPTPQTSVLHLAERPPQHARVTYLLDRGQWNAPTTPVPPHTPQFLHPLEPTSGQASATAPPEPPRLQFARWLVSRQSPLAARVAVNRLWQALFGRGLLQTPEDFGTRAPVPEHLELLDHLAVQFMDSGWSQKAVLRAIVNSQTYRQDSRTTAAAYARDPDNRYLARGPRFRADAEVIRDIALTASGLLSGEMGGPSVIPPVPQNVLDYNYVYPSYWTAATGSQRYRRTLYGFRKRSMPDPTTANFDAPTADTACVQRVRSNTPLAALTGLNEVVFTEAARALGLRILREGGATDAERARYGFLLCTAREPSNQELEVLLETVQHHRQRLADGWLDPKRISTGEERLPELPPGVTPQDAATWTLMARVLLNLDETITRN